MGARPKIRISSPIDGKDKQVLAIQESGAEEVQIFIPHLRNFEHPTKGDVRIKEYRFSVHQSPNSAGNTIAHSIVLADATVVKTSLFTYAKNANQFVPVFLIRLPDMNEPRFNLLRRARDTISDIPGFSIAYNNLIIGLVIGVKGVEFVLPSPFRAISFSTRSWHLHVIYCYMWLPATKTSDIQVAATSTPIYNEIMDKIHLSKGHPGSTNEMTNALISQMLWGITEKYRSRAIFIPQSLNQFNRVARLGLHHDHPYEAYLYGP